MEHNFKIKKGEITFSEKKIVISDNARRNYIIELISQSISALLGILLVILYWKSSHLHIIAWFGAVIGLVGLFNILFMTLRRTSKSQIENKEIVSIVLNKSFVAPLLTIKLNNGKLRRVRLNKEVPEDIVRIISTFN